MDAGKFLRTMMVVSLSLLAVAAILFVQSKFDEGDRRNALALVQTYRSKQGWSLPEVIDEMHPGHPVRWSDATESSCFQHVRVRCYVPATSTAAAVAYDFLVDINTGGIHPGNPDGEKAIRALDRPKPPPTAPPAEEKR